MKKKKAFTLAEVLITLTIIGVIAAITIPTLMKNYQNHANYAALKKTYSIIQNAYKLVENEYGRYSDWVPKNDADECKTIAITFADKMAPHLKIKKSQSVGFLFYFANLISFHFHLPFCLFLPLEL